MKFFNIQHQKILVLLIFVFLIAHSAMAADDSVQDHPGYVDFSILQFLSGQAAKVEVNLKSPLLAMMAQLISTEDTETAALVSQLQRVTVQVFPTKEHDLNQIADAMALTADELDNKGWERVVRVRDNSDHVDIYFKLSDDATLIHGITIMAAAPQETVFVNIVGDINAADIAALSQRFNIEHLQDIDACQFSPDAC